MSVTEGITNHVRRRYREQPPFDNGEHDGIQSRDRQVRAAGSVSLGGSADLNRGAAEQRRKTQPGRPDTYPESIFEAEHDGWGDDSWDYER
jgi:hypothetical protein